MNLFFIFFLGYIWFPKNTKGKKMKKNSFLVFDFTIKIYIIKINLKFIYFKLFNFTIIKRNN